MKSSMWIVNVGKFATLWRSYNENNPSKHLQECNLNNVFANRSDEEEIYPLTTQEVADAQKADETLKYCFKGTMSLTKEST